MTKVNSYLVMGMAFPSLVFAFEASVEAFRDGNIPYGYANVDDSIDPGEAINVSEAPFVDYLIPNNSGSAGITAQKVGGVYIVDSTVSDMGGNAGGANNSTNTDIYHIPFEWSDGTPLPFGADYYGVSWANWGSDSTATLITRINLASAEPTRIYHWFNDGWNYANHNSLEGHNLTVTHFNMQGGVVDSFTAILPSGGAEDIFGDHRQFYTLIIDVERSGQGDFMLISQEGGNIGFKGTAVALSGGDNPNWYGYDLRPDGYVDTTPWMGFIYAGNADAKWVWNVNLGKWIYVNDASGWVYIPK